MNEYTYSCNTATSPDSNWRVIYCHKYDGKNYSTYGKHLNLQEAIDLIKNKGKSSNILRKIDKNIIIKNMESIYLIKIKQM